MVRTKTAPRNREETEARIMAAVQTLLAERGFSAINIKRVAETAGVDKVLIYRYFGKIDDLLAAFARSADFWPSADEVLSPDNDRLPPDERLYAFFDRFIAAMRARPLTVEILAMEIGSPNPLTAALDRARERWAEELAARLTAGGTYDLERLNTVISLLTAGMQYLFIRARHTARFSNLPISEETGWIHIRDHLKWLCGRLFDGSKPQPRKGKH
jgi:AcrR family transcriptional regulator